MLNNLFLSLEGMHKLFTISADDKLVLNNPTYLDYIIFITCDDQDTALGDIFISGHEFVWAKGHLINGQDSGFGLLTLILTLQLQLASLTERVEVLEGATHDFAIAYNLSNVTLDNMTSAISEGENYTAQIIIQEGYTLDNISVFMKDIDITNTTVSGNTITINNVDGNITITANASAIEYTISNNLDQYVENDNTDAKVIYNSGYNANLIFDEGYEANSVQVTMGGSDITVVAYKNNQINIAKVTGNVVITVTSKIKVLNIVGVYTNTSSSNSATSINYGESYTTTLTPDTYYQINSVVVTMGSNNITDIVYNDGIINIPAVTDEIRINAISVIKTHTISNVLTSTINDNPANTINEGDSYNANLSSVEGYHIDIITIEMGGVDITDIAYSDNKITIPVVTGDITITATSVIDNYSITNTLNHVSTNNLANNINYGLSYSATLTPELGYSFSSVRVLMDDVDITDTAYSNGHINIAKVTGNIQITANASIGTFSITNNLTRVTNNNSDTEVSFGDPYNAQITSDTGYDSPIISVMMGGENITSQVVSGNNIIIGTVTGDIVITASAVLKQFTITNNLTHTINDNLSNNITYGSSYIANISSETGYNEPNITVTMGGYEVFVSGNQINIPSVTGDIVITASAIIKTFSITNNLTNVTNNNLDNSADYGESYNGKLIPDLGYSMDNVVIMMGSTNITDSAYNAATNIIAINSVTDNITITANAQSNSYSISNSLTNVTSNNSATSIGYGEPYIATITSNEGYNDPNITVTMNNVDITNTAVTGNQINITNVTGNIVITAVAFIKIFNITNNLTNVTNSNSAVSTNYGETYIATLTPNTHYRLANTTVTMNGVDVPVVDGQINIDKVTGDIIITSTAEIITHTITYNLTQTNSSNTDTTGNDGASYATILTARQPNKYSLSSVTVTMGGTDITAQVVSGGNVNIPALTGDVVITAVSSRAKTIGEVTNVTNEVIINNNELTSGTYTMVYTDAEGNELQNVDKIVEFTI